MKTVHFVKSESQPNQHYILNRPFPTQGDDGKSWRANIQIEVKTVEVKGGVIWCDAR